MTRFVLTVSALAALSGSAAANAATPFVIQGDSKIGSYAVKANGTLDGAIKAFGEPTTMRRGKYRGFETKECVVRWRSLGLRIHFYNLAGRDACERQYGFFRQALITGKQWRTSRGLRIGEPSRRLYALYEPRRFVGPWAWLVSRYTPIGAGGYYPALEAKRLNGWVVAFRVNYQAGGE